VTRRYNLTHEFVEYIPDNISEGVVYISMEYGAVVHKCCCGCGNKVFTPLSPTDWHLTYDGVSVSLSPSVGNGNLPCRSHYWIRPSRVEWLPPITDEETRASRRIDAVRKARHDQLANTEVTQPALLPTTSKWRVVRWIRQRRQSDRP
jgi:hypothetical protein